MVRQRQCYCHLRREVENAWGYINQLRYTILYLDLTYTSYKVDIAEIVLDHGRVTGEHDGGYWSTVVLDLK